ncbi:MAG TPA: hypothetical protein VH134_08910 [Candidatus Dormibacteraeota bacterium]|jgi:hypothetical protein|nr:hypothetical protein [Candidatus Dormibacteraeota bacterium]
MSTQRPTLSDDALLPSPAGAGAGAGQPAIAPWLQSDDHRLLSQLPEPQRGWVLAVCEASHAAGGGLAPRAVVLAAVDRLIAGNADPAAAAAALSG